MFGAIGVLAALREVALGRPGRHVRVSLFDAQLAWLANRASDYLVAGEVPERLGNAHPAIVPYESFHASDGHIILAIGADGQFRRFCAEAGLERLAADPRFATNPDRVRHRLALIAMLTEAIAQRTVSEWVTALERSGVPGGPVRTIPEAFAHAPFATVLHDHALLGEMRTVRSPIALDGEQPTAAAAPPLLGQHTAEVLGELGYEGAELSSLLAGACRSSDVP